MGYNSKKSKHNTGTLHPYQRGYAFWKTAIFWETDSMTEKGKQYFRDSLDRMSKVHNLTKVDQSLQ